MATVVAEMEVAVPEDVVLAADAAHVEMAVALVCVKLKIKPVKIVIVEKLITLKLKNKMMN